MLDIKKIRNELVVKENEERKQKSLVYLKSNFISLLFALTIWIWVDNKSVLIIPTTIWLLLLGLELFLLIKKNNKRKIKEVNYVDGEVQLKPGQVIVTCDSFSYFSPSNNCWKEFKDINPKIVNVIYPQSPTKIITVGSVVIFNDKETLKVLLGENKINSMCYAILFPDS